MTEHSKIRCSSCNQEMEDIWLTCPYCGFDERSFREFSEKLRKYEKQLLRRRLDWKNLDNKILDAYRSKDLSIVTQCQTLIENLLNKPPNKKYSEYIYDLYKLGEISPTENVVLGMLPVLRNVITHGRALKFDPVYFSILLKALNLTIDIAIRKGTLIEVFDIDSFFVKPEKFDEILNKIENNGIVLVVGQPLIGKTTITKKIERIYAKKYEIIKKHPEDLNMIRRNWFIILDNCFGDTKLDMERLERTIDVVEICRNIGCKVLLTSRRDVLEDAKSTEYFKDSILQDIIDEICIEILPEHYKDVYDKLVEKLLKKYNASEEKISEALSNLDRIVRHLKTPGEIDRFCRKFASDKERDINEIIKEAKATDEWVKSILTNVDEEAKYWLTFILIYSRLYGKLGIPIYSSGIRGERELLLESFGKEVVRNVYPGIRIADIYILEYLPHQLKKLRGIIDIRQISLENLPKEPILRDLYLELELGLIRSDKIDEIVNGIVIEFAHDTIMESVERYILDHEPELLRKVFEILKELSNKFKLEDLLINALSAYPSILESYIPLILSFLDDKLNQLKKSIPSQLLNDSELIYAPAYQRYIDSIFIDTPLTEKIDENASELLRIAISYAERLITEDLLKIKAIKDYIYDGVKNNPLFNLIIAEALVLDYNHNMIDERTFKEILGEVLEYSTAVAKKTLIISFFGNFDKLYKIVDINLREQMLKLLLKYPGYFVGEVFTIASESAKPEIIREVSRDYRILKGFITFLILDSLLRVNFFYKFKHSINGLICYEDIMLDDVIVKSYDERLNLDKIDYKTIYDAISQVELNLFNYWRYLEILGFPRLEKFNKAKITSALSSIVKKYGLDYEVILKSILKDNKILFLLTMAEFISEDQKREIIKIALGKHPKDVLLILLHFPNQVIIDEVIKIGNYRKDIIKYILNLFMKVPTLIITNLYALKSAIKDVFDFDLDAVKSDRNLIDAYEEARKHYEFDEELPQEVLMRISNKYGYNIEYLKQIFEILSFIEEHIADIITSILIPAIHDITINFVKELVQQEEIYEDFLKTAEDIKYRIKHFKEECGLEFIGPIIKIDLHKLIDYISHLKSNEDSDFHD